MICLAPVGSSHTCVRVRATRRASVGLGIGAVPKRQPTVKREYLHARIERLNLELSALEKEGGTLGPDAVNAVGLTMPQ